MERALNMTKIRKAAFAAVYEVKGTSLRTVVQFCGKQQIVIENSNKNSFNTSHGATASTAQKPFLSNFNRPNNWETRELYGKM